MLLHHLLLLLELLVNVLGQQLLLDCLIFLKCAISLGPRNLFLQLIIFFCKGSYLILLLLDDLLGLGQDAGALIDVIQLVLQNFDHLFLFFQIDLLVVHDLVHCLLTLLANLALYFELDLVDCRAELENQILFLVLNLLDDFSLRLDFFSEVFGDFCVQNFIVPLDFRNLVIEVSDNLRRKVVSDSVIVLDALHEEPGLLRVELIPD
jgi:hypothetical protein